MLTRLAGLIGMVLLALVATAGPASAHVDLINSTPRDGATLDAQPEQVYMTFSEAVTVPPRGVRFFDAQGAELRASLVREGKVVEVDVPDDLDPGTYVLVWRVVSIDGHPRAGVLTFSVGSPSGRVEAPDVPPAQREWLTTVRAGADAVTYLGLLVTVGLAVFVHFVVPAASGGPRPRVRRALVLAAVIASVAALVRIPLVTMDQQGLAASDVVRHTTWGSVPPDVMLGGLLVAAGCVLVLVGLASATRRLRQPLVLLGVVLALAGPTTTGHTRSLEPPGVAALVDGWHLLAAAVWLGGLLGLALTWSPTSREVWMRSLTRFSGLAAVVLAVLLSSGVLMGWRIVETPGALVGTTYGRLLIAKVALVGVVIAIAAWNRWALIPRSGAAALRRTVMVEAAVLVVVASLTGVLVNQSPRPQPPAPEPVASVMAAGGLGSGMEVVVRLSPGRAGENTVRVVVRDGSGNAVETSAAPEVVLVGPGGERVPVEGLELADGGWHEGTVDLTSGGEWRATVVQRLDEFSQPTAEVLLPVEG